MVSAARRLFWVIASVCFMAGCSDVPVVHNNEVVGTWSQANALQVMVGGSATVTLTFTSDDSQQATALVVTQGTLPDGWSMLNGPVSCPVVSNGNGCLLALRYAPESAGRGALSIQYQYIDSFGTNRSGTATLDYSATVHNNIVATVSPAGEIVGVVGSTQGVTFQFTTDDGGQVTQFQLLTSLSTLPPGWSGSSTPFTCATVSSSNGCQLTLTFAPVSPSTGQVLLAFSYIDNSGANRIGAVSTYYKAINDDTVVGTPSPSGQITAVVGGRNVAVSVGFTTDDGATATGLSIVSGLNTLPSGWSGPTTFTCPSVNGGNGCLLNLSYSPGAAASGTLVLQYQYTSVGGTAKSGSVLIPYVATTDNNVVATPSPSGQIQTIAGGSGRAVTVTFTTDDGNLASNFSITGGLSPLPTGWSVPGGATPPTFGCATLASGNSCQLALLFAPAGVTSGTLQLNYSYTSNAGVAKTGSVTLPYVSTAHNTLVATVSPQGQVLAEINQGIQDVTVTFTSDDGNPVSNILVTSGLTTLPQDWTGPPSFGCTSASTGTGCVLPLQFRPTSASSNGVITVDYTYVDNAGTTQSGSVNISYAAVPIYLYVVSASGDIIRCATSFTDGGVSGCIDAASGFASLYGLTFNGSQLYLTAGPSVLTCPTNADGTLGACVDTAGSGSDPFTRPTSMAVSPYGLMYVTDANGGTPNLACQIDTDATLSNCYATGFSAPSLYNVADGVAIATASATGIVYAYIVDSQGGNLTTCGINAVDGGLENCVQGPIGLTPGGIAAYHGNLYIGIQDGVQRCPIATDGSVNVANCVSTGAGTLDLALPVGFTFNNGFAYVSGYGGAAANGGIYACPVNPTTGDFGACTLSSDPLIVFQTLFGMASH